MKTAADAEGDRAILVVDDDEVFRGVLARGLRDRGFNTYEAGDAAAARAALERHRPAQAVLDLKLGADSGLDLIETLLGLRPSLRIVLLTGYASIPTAVEAIKRGAHQYLAKPTTVDDVVAAFGEPRCAPPAAPSRPLSVARLEWEHIQRVLAEHGGNVSATARALNMHRRTLQRKLSKRPAAG
jgi:two-component system response regulator RegA